VFAGVLEISNINRSGGLGANQAHFAGSTVVEPRVAPSLELVAYDPQTSGGLLIAANEQSADSVSALLAAAGVSAVRIGHARAARPGTHVVVRA
jgi:selenophosphate synthase